MIQNRFKFHDEDDVTTHSRYENNHDYTSLGSVTLVQTHTYKGNVQYGTVLQAT